MQETQYTPEDGGEKQRLREFFQEDSDKMIMNKGMDIRLIDLMQAGHELVRRVSVGRNDKCPCGSWKKFKKCCIDKVGEVRKIPEGITEIIKEGVIAFIDQRRGKYLKDQDFQMVCKYARSLEKRIEEAKRLWVEKEKKK